MSAPLAGAPFDPTSPAGAALQRLRAGQMLASSHTYKSVSSLLLLGLAEITHALREQAVVQARIAAALERLL